MKLSEAILMNPRSIDKDCNLTLVDKNIQTIDKIDSLKLLNFKSLILSKNKITSLTNISQFKLLRELNIEDNLITSIKEILYLRNLTHLEILNISGNPLCSQFPNFRPMVIHFLRSSLKELDSLSITADEILQSG